MPDPRPASEPSRWNVMWCGSVCNGSPHPSREAAEAWLTSHIAAGKRAGAAMYGAFHIELSTEPKEDEK